MGGFNADALLSVYDRKTIFRPFSRELGDMMITTRSLNACRDHVLLDDELYLSYLLLLETNIDFAFRNHHSQKKLVQDLIVELQGLLSDGMKNEVSEELTVLTKQLFFKASADLLAATGSPEEQNLVPILSSLSYQAVDCWVFEQQDVSTWSSFLALDSLTLLLSRLATMTNHALWDAVDIGERIVTAILPKDGSIRRLHSDIFQAARQDCESLMPRMNEKLPDVMAERLVSRLDDERVLKLFILAIKRFNWIDNEANFDIFHFFRQFVKNQPLSTDNLADYTATSFTSVDFAVFLQWVCHWSDITQPGVDVIAKISLTREQILHWKAMVAHIQSQNKTLENMARLGTILKTVRLGHGFRNLRLLFHIFQFLVSAKFPKEWPTLYANMLLRNMDDYVKYSQEHLFPLPAAIEQVTVDEEDRIRQEVFKFLARQAADIGLFSQAASCLEQLSNPTKKVLFEQYTIYKRWLEVADEKEKASILEKKDLVKEQFKKLSSEPISRPPSPASSPTKNEPSTHETLTTEVPTIPLSPIFYSPAVMRDSATSPDLSFVSACSPSEWKPETTMEVFDTTKKETGKAEKTLAIFEDESVIPEDTAALLEHEYLPPAPSFLPELTIEEEEDYYLMMAEQKLNSTRKMFEMTLNQNETVAMFDQTTVETIKSRYQDAIKENERLRKELEMERRNKAPPMFQVETHFLNKTANIFNQTTTNQRHPGHSGVCLGCLSEEEEDVALGLLTRLAEDWNKSPFD